MRSLLSLRTVVSPFTVIPSRFKYSMNVTERYEAAMRTTNRDPNVGSLDKNDPEVGVSSVGSGACGDMLKMSVRVRDGKIVDVKYKTFGCGSAIASSSYVAEYLQGKSIDEAESLTNRMIAKELSLPPVK